MTVRQTPSAPPTLAPGDPHALVAKKKVSLSAKFSPKRMQALFDYVEIAWYLVALDRTEEARAMADWVVDNVPFAGDFNVWTPATQGVALSARLARLGGDDASRPQGLLREHLAVAVMSQERLTAWVGREPATIRAICARKLAKRDLGSLASACAAAAYYRESALPGVYFETWLDHADLDGAIATGTRAMREILG